MLTDYSVRVLRVIDGDSVKVRLPDGEEQSVRMYGIDAPELAQDRGDEAQRLLEEIVGRGAWRLHVLDTDRYQRLVGLLYPENGSPHQSANHQMVEQGLAYWYEEYGGQEYGFDDAERLARRAGVGVWADADAVRPWDFRKTNRGRGKASPSLLDSLLALLRVISRMMRAFSAVTATSSTSTRPRRSSAPTARSVERALTGGRRRRSSSAFRPRRRKKLF